MVPFVFAVDARESTEYMRGEVLYDCILPYLCGDHAEWPPLQPDDAEWRTPGRSGADGWKTLYEACRYFLRQRGASPSDLKFVSLALRRALLGAAQADLARVDDEKHTPYAGLRARPPRALGDFESVERGTPVALFFSAPSWCGPCREFEPRLRAWKSGMDRRGKSCRVMWISGDRDEASFEQFRGQAPWPALMIGSSFAEKQAVWQELMARYGVGGFPTLIFLDRELDVVTREGRARAGRPHWRQLPICH